MDDPCRPPNRQERGRQDEPAPQDRTKRPNRAAADRVRRPRFPSVG
jgi:hypothetical protein